MTTGYLGYITAFDGITVHNGTTKKARTPVGSITKVQENMFELPNGTKINYDGTTDSNETPGMTELKYICTSEAISLYDGLQAKKGNRGTATKTKFSTTSPGTEQCIAVLMDVVLDNEKSVPQKDILYYTLIFEFEGDWA